MVEGDHKKGASSKEGLSKQNILIERIARLNTRGQQDIPVFPKTNGNREAAKKLLDMGQHITNKTHPIPRPNNTSFAEASNDWSE